MDYNEDYCLKMRKLFFPKKQEYLNFIGNWKHCTMEKHCHLTSSHYLLYSVVRQSDWWNIFSPIKNEVKLKNGYPPDIGIKKTIINLIKVNFLLTNVVINVEDKNSFINKFFSPFNGSLTKNEFYRIYEYLKDHPITKEFFIYEKIVKSQEKK